MQKAKPDEPHTDDIPFNNPITETAALLLKPVNHTQKLVTRLNSYTLLNDILSSPNLSEADKARILSCGGKGGGKFLNTSLANHQTRLKPTVFIDSVRRRLGIQPSNYYLVEGIECVCGTKHASDKDAYNCAKDCKSNDS